MVIKRLTQLGEKISIAFTLVMKWVISYCLLKKKVESLTVRNIIICLITCTLFTLYTQ